MSNQFTETIIREAKAALGDDFWGFLMLGGMSGGGMAFFVAPERKAQFLEEAGAILRRVKGELDDALPFAMEPVVYDFRINPHGTFAELLEAGDALMPPRYYTLQVPAMIAAGPTALEATRQADVDRFANRSTDTGELLRVFRTMVNHLFPAGSGRPGRPPARARTRPPRRSGPPTASTRSATSRPATTSAAGGSA